LIVALVAAVLAAGLLVACGGPDSSTSTTASTTEASGASSGNGSEQADSGGARDNGSQQKQNGGASGSGGESSGGSDSGPVATPLRVSGGGSGQFRSKGGDNSIQNYGEEGGESELEEAAEAVHGFYVARAEEDWAKACTYLAKSMVQQLEQLASQSPQLKSKGCGAVLKAFTRPLPASVRRETTVVDAGSLRNDGEHAFLIYYGEDHTPYAMPLEQEDGGWKLTLLSATPLG
jgi:hypothetical protein